MAERLIEGQALFQQGPSAFFMILTQFGTSEQDKDDTH